MPSEGIKRKISAILSADVVGYSKLMEADEETTVRTMESYRDTISSIVQQHNGRVVDSPGDNILSEFPSVVESVQCAVEIQHVIKAKNAVIPEARRMDFRIGIHLGDVIEEKERIYGDGVNIAARLESLADAGGICISNSAYEQIRSKLALGYEDIGEHSVKNIAEPIRVFRIPMVTKAESDVSPKKQAERNWRLMPWAVVGVLIIIIIILAVPRLIPEILIQKEEKAELAAPAPTEKPSIAVLPFNNMSGDSQQEHFVDGMVDEVITRLSMNSSLTVIARNSTFTYKGKPVRVQNVSKDLGARYVVEGSVRKASDRIRITAQMVDATTGKHLWAKTYEREFKAKDIFSLQDEIALRIAAALNAKYTESEVKRVKRLPTENLTAYDYYLQSLGLLFRLPGADTNAEARASLLKAIEMDRQYADAYALLAGTYYVDYYLQLADETDSLERCHEYANKALSLDSSSYHANYWLAVVYKSRKQYDKAFMAIERTIALNPNDADGHTLYGCILYEVGEYEQSIETIRRAIRLNPYPPGWYKYNLGVAYRLSGQHEKAVASQEEALLINPNEFGPRIELLFLYDNLSQEEEARAMGYEILRISPSFSVEIWGRIAPYKDPALAERDMAALRRTGLK